MVDQQRIREAVAAIIEASGDDPDREGLRGTPGRVARLYADFFAGLDQDPREVLRTGFQEDFQDIFILRDIPFFSICEHHLLPMVGEAHIGAVLSAEHMCMALRGVNKPGSRIVTYSTRGSFSSGVSTREDLLAALDRS